MSALRDYQQAAVEAVVTWFKYKDTHAIVMLPTGGGKTHVIAALTEHYYNAGKRIAIIAHRKELLTQNGSKLSMPFGICSASLGDDNTSAQVVVAGIQSIANKQFEPFDIIIIDECHRVMNVKDVEDDATDTSGQYWRFIAKSPNARVVGLSATPYRLKGGKLSWGELVYSVPYQLLLDNGYLTPISNKVKSSLNLDSIKITAGDYNESVLSQFMEDPALIEAAVKNIIAYSADRDSILIFCVTVTHASLLVNAMQKNGLQSSLLSGTTPQGERDIILSDFKSKRLKFIANCEILLEGFDAPNIDMIVCLRPTKSKGLWEQMLGRGVRLYEGKQSCLLIDMANNLVEHGGLGHPYHEASKNEKVKPKGRICPECETFNKATDKQCDDCGYVFEVVEPPKASHNYTADTNSETVFMPLVTYDVKGVIYREHTNRAKGTISLRVDYVCDGVKYGVISEWLSPFNDSDWARQKVSKFFKDRGHQLGSDPNSYTMEDLLWHAEHMNKPSKITVDHNEKFPRIKNYEYENEHRSSNTARTSPVVADILGDDAFIQF
jgi:DNA repair protein RadD